MQGHTTPWHILNSNSIFSLGLYKRRQYLIKDLFAMQHWQTSLAVRSLTSFEIA